MLLSPPQATNKSKQRFNQGEAGLNAGPTLVELGEEERLDNSFKMFTSSEASQRVMEPGLCLVW